MLDINPQRTDDKYFNAEGTISNPKLVNIVKSSRTIESPLQCGPFYQVAQLAIKEILKLSMKMSSHKWLLMMKIGHILWI